jgi:hypothetical protein
MRGPLRPILTLLIAWGISGCYSKPAILAVPQVAMCFPHARWPDLMNTMKVFGKQHGLKFIGGLDAVPISKDKDVPQLNVALAQGYNYYLGDDLDLWITSDPFKRDVVDFGAVVGSPATPEQVNLARGLLARIAPLGSPARKMGDKAVCP